VDGRRVGQVHRQIAILGHQLAHARDIVVIERRETDGTGFDHRPQRGLVDQCRPASTLNT
jgi:hypothetical protein